MEKENNSDRIPPSIEVSGSDDLTSTDFAFQSPFGPRPGGHLSFSFVLAHKDDGEMPNLLDSVQDLMNPRRGLTWDADDAVANCTSCRVLFTRTERKHHCRACGHIFCNKCSSFWDVLDDSQDVYPERPQSWWQSTQSLIQTVAYRGDRRERLCESCFLRLKNRREVKVDALILANLDVKELRIAGLVCKKYHVASVTLLSAFRAVQYLLPSTPLSDIQKQLLWGNRHLLSGHSKYLTKLIVSVDWQKPRVAEEMKRVLTAPPSTQCRTLLCTRYCRAFFSPQDALEVLTAKRERTDDPKRGLSTALVPDAFVRSHALGCLVDRPDSELSCYLPVLVDCLRCERTPMNSLSKFLFERCCQSDTLVYELYWQLKVYTSSTDPDLITLFSAIHLLFRKAVSLYETKKVQAGRLSSQLVRAETLITQLGGISKEWSVERSRLELLSIISTYPHFSAPLILPINPTIESVGIDIDRVQIKDSATRPILLPMRVHETGQSSNSERISYVLYKQEDLRKDYIISSLFRLMDQILQQEENLDLKVITYRVLSTSKDAGMIEFVPKSETLYKIKEKGYTIQNWLAEKNPNLSTGELRDRMVRSTAANCVITYFLGIGDRHLENIMVTESGYLFHIDFGFILGKDPKPYAPFIRITAEMVDALGGKASQSFAQFKDYCCRAFATLRRHVGLFTQILLLLTDAQPPLDQGKSTFSRKELLDHVASRFLPGKADPEANAQFLTRLEGAIEAVAPVVHDWFHAQGKESSSLQTLKDRAVGTVYGLFGKVSFTRDLVLELVRSRFLPRMAGRDASLQFMTRLNDSATRSHRPSPIGCTT